tara:strand:+ start:196 stop:1158 length:963 start_codon:yes stop_codon:yes gene_type:complete
MILRTSFILLLLISTSIQTKTEKELIIGFGSCLHQDHPQEVWISIKKENLDRFFFLGDNVYGDSPLGHLNKMKRSYKKQKTSLPSWLKDITVDSIWDDHDFGKNDGGSTYKLKKQAQELYLEFWEIPISDPRSNREGIYFEKKINFNKRTIQLIGLDTRYFRSDLKGVKGNYEKNLDIDATILGEEQWSWLEEKLRDNFDVGIIASSIQILAKDHPYEKWQNFPNERERLLKLINDSGKNVVLVTGDRHRGGIYKLNNLIELTASSLNRPGGNFNESDKLLVGKTYNQINYGVLEIRNNKVNIVLKDINGDVLESEVLDW